MSGASEATPAVAGASEATCIIEMTSGVYKWIMEGERSGMTGRRGKRHSQADKPTEDQKVEGRSPGEDDNGDEDGDPVGDDQQIEEQREGEENKREGMKMVGFPTGQ